MALGVFISVGLGVYGLGCRFMVGVEAFCKVQGLGLLQLQGIL